jgi:hypothetical protein
MQYSQCATSKGGNVVKLAKCLVVLMVATSHMPTVPVLAQTGYCNTDCDSSVSCDYQCMYGGSFTTCGEYNGGYENGMCAAPEDLRGDSDVSVVWPNDGIPWGNDTNNWPVDNLANNCEGNCGPGCQGWSVCGAPSSYWELAITSSPSVSTSSTFRCGAEDTYDFGTLTTWEATGTWTYHGWTADGCSGHDWVCQPPVVASVAVGIIGYVAFGGFSPGFWWFEAVANPAAGCYDLSWFLTNGACANAGPAVWSYTTSLHTTDCELDHSEPAFPGNCSSRPHCGDAICQEESCATAADGTSPGDGCEEQGGFNSQWCSNDCP